MSLLVFNIEDIKLHAMSLKEAKLMLDSTCSILINRELAENEKHDQLIQLYLF